MQPKTKRFRDAETLAHSWRGQYLISQALTLAVEQMERVQPPLREDSNIADMRLLIETVYPFYVLARKADIEHFQKLQNARKGFAK